MGSPPPAGSKKDVFKFRSVKSIVIAPAKTGRLSSNNSAVINTDHANKVIRLRVIKFLRILIMVVIKLIAPKIEEIPAK